MSEHFKSFGKTSREDWEKQALKELRGKGIEALHFLDPVEGIGFDAYYDADDRKTKNDVPGVYPFQRGFNRPDNGWNNTVYIPFEEEEYANQNALKTLMSGADSVWFHSKKEATDWYKVLDGIRLEYINVQFNVNSVREYRTINLVCDDLGSGNTLFNYDAFALYRKNELREFAVLLKEKQQPAILINGFGIHEAGATCAQEIAFCLASGHQVLVDLLDSGLTIDEATACVHFHTGVGPDYFLEITKIKVLKHLWSKIIREYNPEHACSCNMTITAITGHVNKSLADPHTNLLRQTTEALSALCAGVDHICVLPYDLYSANGVSELASRMALNIPLILKEESYIDKVIDPTAGSYSLDHLHDSLGRKSWKEFTDLEAAGGLRHEKVMTQFLAAIREKRNERIELLIKGDRKLIGVNFFREPHGREAEWIKPVDYLGLETLLLEVEHQNFVHAD